MLGVAPSSGRLGSLVTLIFTSGGVGLALRSRLRDWLRRLGSTCCSTVED